MDLFDTLLTVCGKIRVQDRLVSVCTGKVSLWQRSGCAKTRKKWKDDGSGVCCLGCNSVSDVLKLERDCDRSAHEVCPDKKN